MKAAVRSFEISRYNQLQCQFEDEIFDCCAERRTADYHLKIEGLEKGQVLKIESYTAEPAEGFCGAGSFIQKIPFHSVSRCVYSHPSRPLVSCIILVMFNDLFVRQFLIPSILANTSVPCEIIIVYAGAGADLTLFREFTVIKCEFCRRSRAYNKGVAAAKGRFVALFEEDSIIQGRGWERPLIRATESHHCAVSTESRRADYGEGFEFLKRAPLFMKKSSYERLGGYDENMLLELEDIEFSFRIQRRGLKTCVVSIPFRRFGGLIGLVFQAEHPALLRELFGYCLVPQKAMAVWKKKWANTVGEDYKKFFDRIQALNAAAGHCLREEVQLAAESGYRKRRGSGLKARRISTEARKLLGEWAFSRFNY